MAMMKKKTRPIAQARPLAPVFRQFVDTDPDFLEQHSVAFGLGLDRSSVAENRIDLIPCLLRDLAFLHQRPFLVNDNPSVHSDA